MPPELGSLGADDELRAPPLTDPWAELLMPELFDRLALLSEPVPGALFPDRARRPLESDPASARRIAPLLELALELLVLEPLFPG
jgi:hypothetical protein